MKYLFLALFTVIMITVGIISKKRVNSVDDFFLGGRKMGGWITAFSYGTAYFSSVIFIGYAGKLGWNFGISTIWIGIGNALVGCFLAWLVLGKRTRNLTHKLDAKTMPEFFEKRYGSKSLKIVSALIIFIFLVPYTASVYKGLGYLFEQSFGIDYGYCMLAMAILTGLYLILGGYVATAINDFIQGIIMLGGVVLMVIFLGKHMNGFSSGLTYMSNLENGNNFVSLIGGNPKDLLGLVFLTSVGVWGLPQMIHKFYAIKDETAIKKGTIVSTVFAAVIGIGAYFTGAFGRTILNNSLPEGNVDLIMPNVLTAILPEALLGIIIILVLSASMSTLSSLVLVSSSAITLDFIKGFIRPNMNKKNQMNIMRILCVVFVAISFLVAIRPNETIVFLMSLSWGMIAGCFLGPFLWGLYCKWITKSGVWIGMLTGFCTIIIGVPILGKSAPNIGSLAMILSIVVVPVVSLLTKNKPCCKVSSHIVESLDI